MKGKCSLNGGILLKERTIQKRRERERKKRGNEERKEEKEVAMLQIGKQISILGNKYS